MRPPGQDHCAPGHPQADAERRLFGPAAAHVADQSVHPAVGRLHQVVEVPAEQGLPAAGPVPAGHGQPGIGQQRRRQQPALQPGVLPREDLGLTELALDLLAAAAFHRVPDHPVQQRPVDLALDQIVLRPGADRLLAQVLVGPPGQHDDGDLRQVLVQPAHPLQLPGIRQAEVEQDAGRLRQQRPGLGHRPRPAQGDRGPGFQQKFLDQQGVAVVVLDQQHLHPARRTSRGRIGLRDILSHCPTLFMACVDDCAPRTTCAVE